MRILAENRRFQVGRKLSEELQRRVYPRVPIWVQNLGISLFGFAYQRERLGGAFEKYVTEFRARDRWSKAEMEAYVQQQLRKTLLHAFDNVPYYRGTWQRLGITRGELAGMGVSDLSRIPPTLRANLTDDPEAFLDRRVAASRLHCYSSSGSTNTPVVSLRTSDAHRRFFAAREARSFGWAGASIRMTRSTVGGKRIVPGPHSPPPYYRYNWSEKQLYLSAYHIGPDTVLNYLEGFNRYKPQLLTGYAHSYYSLANLLIEKNRSLDYAPRALVLCAEKLTKAMKDVIYQVFHARAYEEYGSVENCALATECEYGSLHVNPDFGIVEIVDERNIPVAAGETGRIVCTGLLNKSQPLIRYEVGDLGSWSTNRCPCQRDHFPVLQELVGRIEDVVYGLNGQQMSRFHAVFLDLPAIREAQVIQETLNFIRVRVVVRGRLSAEDQSIICQRLRDQLGPVQIEVDRVDSLERTKRGKVKTVISHLTAAQGAFGRAAAAARTERGDL